MVLRNKTTVASLWLMLVATLGLFLMMLLHSEISAITLVSTVLFKLIKRMAIAPEIKPKVVTNHRFTLRIIILMGFERLHKHSSVETHTGPCNS